MARDSGSRLSQLQLRTSRSLWYRIEHRVPDDDSRGKIVTHQFLLLRKSQSAINHKRANRARWHELQETVHDGFGPQTPAIEGAGVVCGNPCASRSKMSSVLTLEKLILRRMWRHVTKGQASSLLYWEFWSACKHMRNVSVASSGPTRDARRVTQSARRCSAQHTVHGAQGSSCVSPYRQPHHPSA